jgi:pimeloyl-ACP methyl ester carboxylesterase
MAGEPEWPGPPHAAHLSIQQRRRRSHELEHDDGLEAMDLVREDGVLRWIWRTPSPALRQGRSAWRSVGLDPRDVVQRFPFRAIGRNRITAALCRLDHKLNPARGLSLWTGWAWKPVGPAELQSIRGRVLLLVHGTFSSSGMFDREFRSTPEGRRLFDRWTGAPGSYAAVLAFDHATLSEGPWLNALALVKALEPLRARMDVLCHSRGGLVASWAMRFGLPRVEKVIFVGSPLAGTSLASPDKLREALDLLANVADAMQQLAKQAASALVPAMPIALGAAGLAMILGRALRLGADLPLPDAVVGLVPGLLSQSAVDNNLELDKLFPLSSMAELSAVGAEFEPDVVREPAWKFWNRFTRIADQAKYYGAKMIFDQPNDLVVDTGSMFLLGSDTADHVLLLGGTSNTHHCSYFRNQEVIDFLHWRLR